MAITNIYDIQYTEHIEYQAWILSILYLERIIEQNNHTRGQYNYGVVTQTQTAQIWMQRQKEYLVPLVKHQMSRNLAEYKDHLTKIEFSVDIDEKDSIEIPKYVCDLFEHFCDNKARTFLDLSCIVKEIETMDESLVKILFQKENEYEINQLQISALFPNAKEYKNQHNEWISLPSLKTLFDEIKARKLEKRKLEHELMQTSDQNNEKNVIQFIDEGIAMYYQHVGSSDYFDIDGIGKFQRFCDDNGYDSDNIDEELDNAQDSMLVEFDDNFPLHTTMEDDERNEFIFNIIIQCKKLDYKFITQNPDVTSERWVPSHSFFDVSIEFIAEIEIKYKKQCSSIWMQGLKTDESLKKVIAIGQKNNVPYLQYLVDTYTRQKIEYMCEEEKLLSISDWASNNHYMKQVKILDAEKHTANFEMILHAVKSFCTRIAPQINLKPVQFIVDDDLDDIARRICDICTLTEIIPAGSLDVVVPFQMDFTFIFNKTSSVFNNEMRMSDDDDEYDDDYDAKVNNPFVNIDNISEALDSHQLPVKKDEFFDDNTRNQERGDILKRSTVARELYKLFIDLSRNRKNKNSNHEYPHQSRFCGILDRRGNSKKIKNKVYMYDAPGYCNEISSDHVPELYFELCKKCLIPQKGNTHITSETVTPQIMCLSFHIDAEDDVKCYLYYNGGMMRFFGNDIFDVLPRFFVDDEKKAKFVTNQGLQRDIKNGLARQLRDSKFDSFFQYATQ
eukprot:363677_1